jgi:uracil-DNA glycosylase family protein
MVGGGAGRGRRGTEITEECDSHGWRLVTAEPLIPPRASLPRLREAAALCRACPLWKLGTQTVFGEGPRRALLMLVGEQPGDREDLAGRPFVGPSGALLDAALEEAGFERAEVYLTNVVKHFKWEPRGKRRIHKKPDAGEITACRPWLDAEIRAVKPQALVCLGATAAQALLGHTFLVSKRRGLLVPSDLAPIVSATVHPSSVLRSRTDDERRAARNAFARDLANVRRAIEETRR